MKNVRLGIIGIGNMGGSHATNVLAGKVPGLELTAVCDTEVSKCARFSGVRAFASAEELIASGLVDAVLIATPHYDHVTIGVKVMRAGLHLLVEKPIAVHRADAERLIAAQRGPGQIFAAMFNQRTNRHYQKIRQMIQQGELGEIRRVNWIITNWFRSEAYYASGGWRATWAGEGGGVLLNQCPHNLDLFQWMFGLPVKVRAHCAFGKYHQIEVEDDVTAYMEFANGATGVFITSTGEAPGTNRLEITGERGKLVYEGESLIFTRNEVPMSEFSRTTTENFARPPVWHVEVPVTGQGGGHNEILANFTAAIREGSTLLSPAPEGIHSVELGNAMLLSAWTDKTVSLPINGRTYERWLKKKIAESKPRKKIRRKTAGGGTDFAQSFGN
jgi:predicted dehydrogenase